ncbi:diguanylate cyclase domain-containing protein [Jannaschia pohangensis]|uniref:guanylate cyclase n=1 Tax=Jannaschia pohangensis TaxID=390807 RepID=A0A1I3SH91_9RHOB|nr:diguanylate cyclase [Jannaschia pohangensis]SFJ57099.1 diguanylate cyclase (GGDEF) domain-containing protein [Jannaschia pohangensis]
MTAISLDLAVLDGVVPMALIFDQNGIVEHMGPTLAKMASNRPGAHLSEILDFRQPRIHPTFEAIMPWMGRRLKVAVRAPAGSEDRRPTPLRCVAVPLADGRCVLAMSLGADPTPQLRRHNLSANDFSDVDPTVDLLFLLEAHRIVLEQFGHLSDRLEQARLAAEEEAATDKLTGLRNRRAMDLHLERLTRQRKPNFGLMHLDLDYFKAVNDTLGHAAGDRVLEQVAVILRQEVRRGDMVARVGGDEFILVFDDCSDLDFLKGIAARIIDRLEQPIDWQGHECRVSGSIGITMSSFYDTLDPDQLIADADKALYSSKRAGRARHAVATPRSKAFAASGNGANA